MPDPYLLGRVKSESHGVNLVLIHMLIHTSQRAGRVRVGLG